MPLKITHEMQEALHKSQGGPIEVEDEAGQYLYVLVDKSTFAHLREVEEAADEASQRHLRSLIEEGIASGDYRSEEYVFNDLLRYAEELSSHPPE